MLTERKIRILTDVIRSYVRGAHPVGSQAVVSKSGLNLSAATIRNEMLELEREGYLSQPHTSAGRIPTEKAWRHYLKNIMEERSVTPDEKEELRKIISAYHDSRQDLFKHLAQTLAELMKQAAFVAFNEHDTYYTGISKLFNQPEFEELDLIRAISEIVDNLDDLMPEFFSRLDDDVTVLLGKDNPLSEECGLILSAIPRHPGLFGVLGPIRQDYDGHVSLMRYTRQLLT